MNRYYDDGVRPRFHSRTVVTSIDEAVRVAVGLVVKPFEREPGAVDETPLPDTEETANNVGDHRP